VPSSRYRWFSLALLALLLGLAPSARAEEPEADPILDGVVEMLQAEISEPVILEWLDSAEETPRRPTAGELVELKEAGASEELLSRLIEISRALAPMPPILRKPVSERAATPVPPRASDPPPSRERPVPPVVATPEFAEPGAVEPRAAEPRSADGLVTVEFEFAYVPNWGEGETVWDLYVYIDGKPLSYVAEGGQLFDENILRFSRRLEPDRHVLRVLQERHEGGRRATHEARVAPDTFAFELAAAPAAEIELFYREPMIDVGQGGGPLAFRFAQGNQVEVLEDLGGDPAQWPELCEEIEVGVSERKRASASFERDLEGCVRWRELWEGIEAPPRGEVREYLEQFDYRPVPKNQELD